jgi:hypothetical protein
MPIRATSKWSAVVAILAVMGCSDDSKAPVPDKTVVQDQSPTGDRPVQRMEKEYPAERGNPGEARPGDSRPSTDSKLADRAVTPDQSDPSCKGVTCTLINDCCDCTTTSGTPWTCGISNCKVDTCTSVGITQPSTRCLNGHCPLESDKTGCIDDKECKKLDDCCTCGAVPVTASAPACAKLCTIDTCTSWGLSKLVARCAKGVCRLAP